MKNKKSDGMVQSTQNIAMKKYEHSLLKGKFQLLMAGWAVECLLEPLGDTSMMINMEAWHQNNFPSRRFFFF